MLNREQMIILLGVISALASLGIGMARTAIVSEHRDQNKKPDYERLSKLLAAGAFLKADRLTYRMMLIALKKYPDQLSESVYLTEADIAKFPCEDLLKIDELWHQYTQGKFSFTTQQQIWMNVQHRQSSEFSRSESFEHFAQAVNWKVAHSWKSYEELTFDLQAHPGHLPALVSGGSVSQEIQIKGLKQKTDQPLWEFNVNCVPTQRGSLLMNCTPNLSQAIFSRLQSCQTPKFIRIPTFEISKKKGNSEE